MGKPLLPSQDQLNRKAMVIVTTIVRIKSQSLKVMVVLMALISLGRGGNCEFSGIDKVENLLEDVGVVG